MFARGLIMLGCATLDRIFLFSSSLSSKTLTFEWLTGQVKNASKKYLPLLYDFSLVQHQSGSLKKLITNLLAHLLLRNNIIINSWLECELEILVYVTLCQTNYSPQKQRSQTNQQFF